MKNKLLYLKIVFGLFIVFYISNKIGFSNITKTMLGINLLYIPLMIIILFVALLLNAFNVKLFLDSQNYNVDFWKYFRHYLASSSIGMFLPGKIGDFSLYYLIKEDSDVKTGHSLSAIFLDKIITLAVVSLISFLGVLILFSEFLEKYLLIIGTILLLFIMAFIVIMTQKRILSFLLGKHFVHLNDAMQFFSYVLKEKKFLIFLNFLVTVLKSFVIALLYYAAFLAFDYKISLMSLFFISSITTLISQIPLSFSGLVISEVAAVFFLNKISVPNIISFNSYIVVTIVVYFVSIINLVLYKNKKLS